MKRLLSLTAILLLTACGSSSKNPTSKTASFGDHYTARNCEIFIDKLLGIGGSHYHDGLSVFVKILPNRLDSAVTEVGFHSLRTGRDMSGTLHEQWQDRLLTPFMNSKDYFYFSSALDHDFGFYAFDGVFYVRTQAGTTYWLKPSDGSENFHLDSELGRRVIHAAGAEAYDAGDPSRGVATQDSQFKSFNPDQCR